MNFDMSSYMSSENKTGVYYNIVFVYDNTICHELNRKSDAINIQNHCGLKQ